MQEALKQAILAFNKQEIPVGAVIVDKAKQKIISYAHNLTQQQQNPLAHAEIIAIYKACSTLKTKNLTNYDIYVTLEPCAMCACAISQARLSCLFYGASDPKQGAVASNLRYFNNKACFHRPEIYDNILPQESELLMKKFFREVRS